MPRGRELKYATTIYYIYKTIDLETGEYYIGRRKYAYTRNPITHMDIHYFGSGNNIRERDKDKLLVGVMEYCDSWKEMCNREYQIIQEHIDDPRCLNLTVSGNQR